MRIIFEDEHENEDGSVFVEKVNLHIGSAGKLRKVVVYDAATRIDEIDYLKGKDKSEIEKLLKEKPGLLGMRFNGWEISSITGY